LTKLDVLSGCSTIRICEGYKLADGTVCDEMPIFGRASQDIVPIYNELPGWDDDISSVRSFADLPVNARRYLEYVATITERPVVMVGVGQSRDATVWTPDTPQELYEFVGA
jgi:adenylosuccinate synthase